MSHNNMPHRMLKAKGANTAVFVNFDDCEALDAVRARHGNRDLSVSAASYAEADPSSPCIVRLYFCVTCICIEQMRRSVLEAVYYIPDNFGIPPESMYLIYNGGGLTKDDGQTNADTHVPAQIVILVPPSIFDGRPTPLMPALNYDLARQMREDSVAVEIDVYSQEQQFVPLCDAIVGATGRFAVSPRIEELLYLDPEGILSLSKQPRGDDFLVVDNPVPEAAEWYAEVLGTAEKRQKQQLRLKRALLQRGWFVPPCIRRIEWAADTAKEQALEACRIAAMFYSFIGAGTEEVYEHVRRIDRRNCIRDYSRLGSIIAFSMENGAFPGCTDPLLRQFCPAGGCFMHELIDECRRPRLFQWEERIDG